MLLSSRGVSQPATALIYRRAYSEASKPPPIHDDNPKPTNPLLNPPASTRPPPLTLPQRGSFQSTPQYLFALGKGYLSFYKNGVKALWANWKLLRDKLERTPANDRPSLWMRPSTVPRSFSRADWVLLWRVRHDMARLPLFAVMLIVIGEWMAVVVLYVDAVVPYTCRIPRQLFKALEKTETRRKTAFEELDEKFPHGVLSPGITQNLARTHVLRSLNLTSRLWDRAGFFPPGIWSMRGQSRLVFLEGDDKNLVEDGGPTGLEYEELRIACAERGVDILGKSKTELSSWLGDWLRLTAAEDNTERRRRMAVLLLTR